jgi:hypothetical protein
MIGKWPRPLYRKKIARRNTPVIQFFVQVMWLLISLEIEYSLLCWRLKNKRNYDEDNWIIIKKHWCSSHRPLSDKGWIRRLKISLLKQFITSNILCVELLSLSLMKGVYHKISPTERHQYWRNISGTKWWYNQFNYCTILSIKGGSWWGENARKDLVTSFPSRGNDWNEWIKSTHVATIIPTTFLAEETYYNDG